MEAQQRRAAKVQMIALMQTGHRWQEAAAQAGIKVSRSTAYRRLAPCAHPWESCLAGWQTWASYQTAPTRTPMARNDLSRSSPHA